MTAFTSLPFCWLFMRLMLFIFIVTTTTAWTFLSLPTTGGRLAITTTKTAVTFDTASCLIRRHQQRTTIFFAHHELPSTGSSNRKRKSRLALSLSSSSSTTATEQQETNKNDNIKNQLSQDLFDFANEVGQVGAKTTKENQQTMETLANALIPFSDDAPARVPLVGTHLLQYSASPGGSSGQIGPLVGKVEQRFLDSEKFYNVVRFPPLGEVKLLVEREIMDDTRIKVKFVETCFMLFDKFTVKQFPVKGVGVWKQLFVGQVNVTLPGSSTTKTKILLRVMEAPSLFIIYQILE